MSICIFIKKIEKKIKEIKEQNEQLQIQELKLKSYKEEIIIRREEWKDKNVLINKEEEIIEKVKELTNKKITKLIYRGSKDGFKASTFHSKCDGHSNTIIIIKVKN